MSCSVNRKRTKADVNTVIGESDVESSDTSSEDTDATDSETQIQVPVLVLVQVLAQVPVLAMSVKKSWRKLM